MRRILASALVALCALGALSGSADALRPAPERSGSKHVGYECTRHEDRTPDALVVCFLPRSARVPD